MSVVDDLRRCGLDVSGQPPAVEVAVGGTSVRVRLEEADGRVVLHADLAVPPTTRPGSLLGADLSAGGDTSFTVSGSTLVGTRTLIEAPLGTLYDTLFDLAKATTSVSRLLSDLVPLAPEVASLPADTPAPLPLPPVSASSTEPIPVVTPPPPPSAPAKEFWFYVETEQQLQSGGKAHGVVGTLRPGQWYWAIRQEGDWVKATGDGGVEGWVKADVVRRET